jgi:L-aspartate oxidase
VPPDPLSSLPCQPVDLVVVGGGVAGLFAALVAASEARVLVVSKTPLLGSASCLAQGGIAASVGADDSPALHAGDTLEAGRGLCAAAAVDVLTVEAPARIRDLEQLGVEFDDDLSLEGGHGRRRVVHAGGAATGDSVTRLLARRALAHPRIEVVDRVGMKGLRMQGDRVVGISTTRGPVAARATLLATGGLTSLWSRTTNPPGSVGDGVLAAFRAGAAVADLEFVQFHPTALAGTSVLLSEALRGEGALLLDESGERFTDELAPRDVVARAIASRGSALLDLRAIDRDRFPSLMGSIGAHGFDPASEAVPVSPAAHYSIGGVVTDLRGRTDVPSLLAAGECAATGVHGANRLASNSLLECLVFGRRAALAALEEPPLPASHGPARVVESQAPTTDRLREALWRDCGLFREAEGLARLAAADNEIVRLVARSAQFREESRGCHFRTDFPGDDPALARHVVLRRGCDPALEAWS